MNVRAVEGSLSGELAEDVTEYRVGLRFHWMTSCTLLRVRASFADLMREDLTRDFSNGNRNDIFLDDVEPAVLDCARTIACSFGRLATSRLRYTHGNPA